MRILCLGLIRFYQLAISPFTGSCCRFAPSCSEYAREAFERHPPFKALCLTLCRLLKCGPWHSGGHDPCP